MAAAATAGIGGTIQDGAHVREHTSVLAAAEKRLLVWTARRLPPWVTSDGLTALAALADDRRRRGVRRGADGRRGRSRSCRCAWPSTGLATASMAPSPASADTSGRATASTSTTSSTCSAPGVVRWHGRLGPDAAGHRPRACSSATSSSPANRFSPRMRSVCSASRSRASVRPSFVFCFRWGRWSPSPSRSSIRSGLVRSGCSTLAASSPWLEWR